MSPDTDQLAEWFDRLVDLDPAARAAQLAVLEAPLREALERLLGAEAGAGDLLAETIAAVAAPGTVQPGQRIGAWRIVREIGAGGMGTVFLAERAEGQFAQQAAIKLIRGFPTEEGRRRLRLERQILAGLDHPHIARLLDGGETADGQPWVAMEYVEGEDLVEHVARHAPSLAARLALFDRIAAAVQHAHQRLVVHRDLKPRNVRVRPDGEPRLLDFGVAKLLDLGTAGSRDTSTRVWTPGYASPEQQRGGVVTTATDVYSLGVMLRELLTGERADARGAMAAPSGFVAVDPDAELRGVIALATAPEPDQRYPSVEALREDLARWRDGRPLRAAPDTRWYRARKFVARHRLGSVAAAAALVGVALFVWRLGAERDRALAAESAAVAARQEAEAARAETQRQLQRASQAVEYLGGLFAEAAPDRNRGLPVDVRQLVALGERRLDGAPPSDPGVAADMATLLGQLYLRLGAAEDAIRMLRRGLDGQQPDDAVSAAEVANRHDLLASALLDIDRRDEALVEAEAARDLRARWLPGDPAATLRTAYSTGLALYALRRFDEAAARIAEALVLQRANPGLTDIELLDTRSIAAGIDVDRARFADALAAIDAALAEPGDAAVRKPTLLIEAYRTRARALQGLGRLAEAAEAFDAAIAKHRELIGDDGARIAGLHNDHGILLAQFGRFADAVAAYDAGAAAYAAAGGADAQDDTRYLNNVCDAWNGHGDYARAAVACTRAVALIRERRPEGDVERLFVESQNARTVGLLGRYAEAAVAFDSVIERAAATLGETALPLGIHLYRAARAAQLGGDLARAERLATRARPIFEATFASPHHWRGRMARLRGLIALGRGELDTAGAAFDEAAAEFAGGLPAGHFLAAQIEADRAALALARGDAAEARRRLTAALGPLRATCAPGEVDRVAAEGLARRLGLPPPP